MYPSADNRTTLLGHSSMASKWEVMDVEVTVKHHSTVTTHKENCRYNHRAVNLFSNHCDVELQEEEPSSPFSLSYRHFPGRYHQVPSCQLKPPMTPPGDLCLPSVWARSFSGCKATRGTARPFCILDLYPISQPL